MRRLSQTTLNAIRARCEKATPGPWRWVGQDWNEAKYLRPDRNQKGRRLARAGQTLRNSWVMLLQGPARHNLEAIQGKTIPEIVESRRADEHDFYNVFGFRWNVVKGEHFIDGPSAEDEDFIGWAREDVPTLLCALEAAYDEIDRLQTGGKSRNEVG